MMRVSTGKALEQMQNSDAVKMAVSDDGSLVKWIVSLFAVQSAYTKQQR